MKSRVAWGLAVVLAMGTMIGCAPDLYSGRPFVRQDWLAGSRIVRQQSTNADNPRCKMVADLMSHHLKPGMTHQQVLQLLGKPDDHCTQKQFRERTGYTDQQIGL